MHVCLTLVPSFGPLVAEPRESPSPPPAALHRIGRLADKWVRFLPCADARTPQHGFCMPNKNPFRRPTVQESCCFRRSSARCFRAVYDNRIVLPSDDEPWSPAVFTRLTDQIQRVLESDLGVRDVAPFRIRMTAKEANFYTLYLQLFQYSSAEPWKRDAEDDAIKRFAEAHHGIGKIERWMKSTGPAASNSKGGAAMLQPTVDRMLRDYAANWSAASIHSAASLHSMHADYLEESGYQFSALLYLTDKARVPLLGGETGFADELVRAAGENTTQVRRGTVVAPLHGRLLLFSGGGENYHTDLPVVQGRRCALNIFFHCTCEEQVKEDYDVNMSARTRRTPAEH